MCVYFQVSVANFPYAQTAPQVILFVVHLYL